MIYTGIKIKDSLLYLDSFYLILAQEILSSGLNGVFKEDKKWTK